MTKTHAPNACGPRWCYLHYIGDDVCLSLDRYPELFVVVPVQHSIHTWIHSLRACQVQHSILRWLIPYMPSAAQHPQIANSRHAKCSTAS
eukprot:1143057-Pelagomonas_calceolata.AAC.3